MRGLLTLSIVMILGGVIAQGHHSIAAAYDRDRPVKLDGILVQFAMVQPHPFVVVEIKDGRDTARWRGELDNRWELVAIGMTEETLKPGDRLVLSGSVGRNQPRSLYVMRLDRPADGFWYEQVGMSPRVGFNRGG
jgi:Family of unknown function (DUF6152)